MMSWSSQAVSRKWADLYRKSLFYDDDGDDLTGRAIEDERSRMLERAFDNFIVPLEIFRKDQVIMLIMQIMMPGIRCRRGWCDTYHGSDYGVISWCDIMV